MRFLMLALVFALPVQAGDRDVATGDWAGLGYQQGETWEMELQVAEGGARVDYPGIPCGGLWVFETDTQSVRGQEWLTYGKDLCLDGLTVIARPTGEGLMIHWYDDAGLEVAYAPLTRVEAAGRKSGKK